MIRALDGAPAFAGVAVGSQPPYRPGVPGALDEPLSLETKRPASQLDRVADPLGVSYGYAVGGRLLPRRAPAASRDERLSLGERRARG